MPAGQYYKNSLVVSFTGMIKATPVRPGVNMRIEGNKLALDSTPNHNRRSAGAAIESLERILLKKSKFS